MKLNVKALQNAGIPTEKKLLEIMERLTPEDRAKFEKEFYTEEVKPKTEEKNISKKGDKK